MSFWKNFSNEASGANAVLINIGPHAISGAYGVFNGNGMPGKPLLAYVQTVPIAFHEGEEPEKALYRALEELIKTLAQKGSPALSRASGSSTVDSVILSIDAPWQKTRINTEVFERDKPFLFSKHLIEDRISKTEPEDTEMDHAIVDESLIGAVLNGYETHNPYGHTVHRALVVLFCSLIRKEVADQIMQIVHNAFRVHDIRPISGTSLRYQVVRKLFPHERSALIVDAVDLGTTSVSLVRNDLFVMLKQIEHTEEKASDWLGDLQEELRGMAEVYPLPQTVFLLAKEDEVQTLQEKLNNADFNKLWLAGKPPRIVPILKRQLANTVRLADNVEADVGLQLITLFCEHHNPDEHPKPPKEKLSLQGAPTPAEKPAPAPEVPKEGSPDNAQA